MLWLAIKATENIIVNIIQPIPTTNPIKISHNKILRVVLKLIKHSKYFTFPSVSFSLIQYFIKLPVKNVEISAIIIHPNTGIGDNKNLIKMLKQK